MTCFGGICRYSEHKLFVRSCYLCLCRLISLYKFDNNASLSYSILVISFSVHASQCSTGCLFNGLISRRISEYSINFLSSRIQQVMRPAGFQNPTMNPQNNDILFSSKFIGIIPILPPIAPRAFDSRNWYPFLTAVEAVGDGGVSFTVTISNESIACRCMVISELHWW